MAGQRLRTPAASALSILEEYHKDVESRLKDYGFDDVETHQITTDVYAKDDIYFSFNRPYERIKDDFTDFCQAYELHHFLPDMLPWMDREDQSLYEHQARAIESILAEQTTIIATGTGSGKTESFLIPILHYCLNQNAMGHSGIKAIILYPLNALANDQIRRITKAVKGRGIRVGCFVGSTPEYKVRKGEPDELCICRKEMKDKPPDILITNYVMLDRLITKPETRSMFVNSEHTIKYIVVDEVHFFRGIKGANLSLLLRRLRAVCKQPLVQIGASGTLRRSGGYYPDDKQGQIQQFARLIFGLEAITKNGLQLIEPVFKQLEPESQLEPLPEIDDITSDIKDDILPATLDKNVAAKLYEQLSGHTLSEKELRKDSFTPLYDFAIRSEFINSMRKKLVDGACTFNQLVELFCELYRKNHHREPRNPKEVVKAYWSLINQINHRCAGQKPLILDYRLHLILGDVGDSLTRCLRCKRYHDGRCSWCRYCNNGLLFKVSKKQPDLCIGYLIGSEIFPDLPSHFETTIKMSILIQIVSEHPPASGIIQSHFALELKEDPTTDQESYILRPAQNEKDGVVILFAQDRQELEELPLCDPRLYWHNVLKAIDALVVHPETKTTDKLLGFIDNKERASSIKLRLNDEIADSTLTDWAINNWLKDEEITLLDAFNMLQKAIPTTANDEEDAPIDILLNEMPFWFSRMLTFIDEYKDWEIFVNKTLGLMPYEQELLQEIMLREGAIDRTSFPVGDLATLKHFYLEKYRVTTEYGIGMRSPQEQGFDVTSLGEQGRIYEDFIGRMKGAGINIQEKLDELTKRGILVQKQTSSIVFYQLHPRHIQLKSLIRPKTQGEWRESFITVECHTADHSDRDRAEIEARFLEKKIKTLICTPTLEMGVDIGNLSSVLMIGFPPSPANYAQRAGRAGRSAQNRLATIVVLSSAEDPHDEYYYSNPRKMIDGAITPPQFTLTNFALLATHVYAYLAGNKKLFPLNQTITLRNHIRDFVDCDPLHLQEELSQEDFAKFREYLYRESHKLVAHLRNGEITSMEECYRLGIFPDYGFRHDGLPLIKHNTFAQREDEEKVLTVREPEEASRKLVPGRIVFCGGRAVKIDENQPDQNYQTHYDPDKKVFRLYSRVVTNEKNEVQIEKKRDPDSLYRISRILDMKKPLEALEMRGPAFCRVYLVHQGTLFFINEGELRKSKDKALQPLKDAKGEYRFGTSLERDGLLVHFADHILPPNMKANLLAVLLRCIPDYFDLDDSELRIAKNVHLHPQPSSEPREWTSFFIYGHDESGLVPCERIFENLEKMLTNALHTLKTCSCGGEGCYLCLFSLNSRSLTGRISRQEAIDAVSVFLRESLLKPHLALTKSVMGQSDITLSISLSGKKCLIVTENAKTGQKGQYIRENASEDQSTGIYTALREALEQERIKGAQTVRIYSKVDYIGKQLTGENDVKAGREAFLKVWLSLLGWQDWELGKD